MNFFTLNGKTIKGAAFDMDGTLIDCSSSRAATQRVAGENFHVDWSQCGGKGMKFIFDWLSSRYPDFIQNENEFISSCHTQHLHALHQLEPRKGILSLLDIFNTWSIPIAVVTNTDAEMAKMRLQQCGILKHIKFVIGADTLLDKGLQLKPAPDGYKLAAQLLGYNENEMIGFEDSEAGMNALNATQFATVHIYDETISPIQTANVQIDVRTDSGMNKFIESIKLSK